MALIIPPGTCGISLELRHEEDPDPWYITYGVDSSGAGGDLEDIGQSQMAQFIDAWRTQMPPDMRVSGCAVVVGQDGPDPVRAFFIPPDPDTGSNAGARLPQNCALLVRKNTNQGGRRNRGRLFLPGILAEAEVSAVGLISSAALSGYQAAALAFFNNLVSPVGTFTPTPMILLHSEGNSAVPDPTPVVSLTCDSVISTQRRRLR